MKASRWNSDDESKLSCLMASAERELGAFLNAVTASFGPEEGRLAAEDWLEELESTDTLCELTASVLRTITIASAVRLAARLKMGPCDTKVSPIRSSNCSSSEHLA